LNIWTNSDPVIISGFAQDNQYIKKISISHINILIEKAQKKQQFAEALTLLPGQNELLIIAENLLGGITKTNITVNVDRTGPLIIVEKILPDIYIEGFIYDNSGEIKLVAENKQVKTDKGIKVPFKISLVKGKKIIEIVASDKAGNKTKAIINTGSIFSKINLSSKLFAQIDQPYATDAYVTVKKPEIIIDRWTEYNTIYSDKVKISGSAQSFTDIISLEINNSSILHEKGQNLFFSKSVSLSKGDNRIIIKAIDQSGNVNKKEIIFTSKIKEVFKLKHRFGMKIYPFDQYEEDSESEVFFYHLVNGLHNKNRFRIFFSNSFQKKYFNITSLQNIPEDLSNIYFLKGIIYEADNGIEIVGRIFDINSENVDYVDVYEEFEHTVSLKNRYIFLANRLSKKFHITFPLITGVLKKTLNKRYEIFPKEYHYKKKNIRLDWPVIIYRHENTDNINFSETIIIGRSKISRIMENSFDIKAIDETIFNGDYIITQ